MISVEHVVVGGGIVGLAVAHELSKRHVVALIEMHPFLCFETSSRNSQVIHAGLYYPPDTLKSRLCISGNKKLYSLLESAQLPHSRCGKLIVGGRNQVGALEKLRLNAKSMNVELDYANTTQLRSTTPLKALFALFSPSTGWVDVHALSNFFQESINSHGSFISLRSRVSSISYLAKQYHTHVNTSDGQSFILRSNSLINAAGLSSDAIAKYSGVDVSYSLCKGNYYSCHPPISLDHHIYPLPDANSLGVHATLGADGMVKFGPDVEWVDEVGYQPPSELFISNAKRHVSEYLEVDSFDFRFDYAGIRPKLRKNSFSDFVIREESLRGYPRFINLLGIESPGLTSCIAIAEHVSGLLDAH